MPVGVQCPVCSKMFITVQLMENHVVTHHAFKPSLGKMRRSDCKCWCGVLLIKSIGSKTSVLRDILRKHWKENGGVQAHYLACKLEGKPDGTAD